MAAPTVGAVGTHLQNTSATAQVPIPAGVVKDSVVYCYLYLASSTITAMAPGFQHAVGSPQTVTGAGSHSHAVVWKRATGTDGAGTYDFTLSVSDFHEADAVRYEGCVKSGDPAEGGNGLDTTGVGATTSPPVSLTTTGSDRLIIWTATCWAGGSWTPPAGYAEQFDAGVGLQTGASVAQPVAGSTGSVSGTCTNSDKRTAWIGALMPDVPTPAAPSVLSTINPLLFQQILVAVSQMYRNAASIVQVRPQTGTSSLGLAGRAAVVKVATPVGRSAVGLAGTSTVTKIVSQTGRCGIGLAGYAVAVKKAPETGTSAVGLAGQAIAVKKAPETGTSAVGLAGRGASIKTAKGVATASIGLAGRGSQSKVIAQTGLSAIGLVGIGPTQGSRAQTGRCSIGLGGYGSSTKKAVAAGRSAIGLSTRAVAVKRAPETGTASMGLSARSVALKRAVQIGTSSMGMAGRATVTKKASETGRSAIGLSAYSSAGKKVSISGRSCIGLGGYGPRRGSNPGAFLPFFM